MSLNLRLGLTVHPNPLPVLRTTLETTLQKLSQVPSSSVYRQATTALAQQKLSVLDRANGDVALVEKDIDQGQIEEVLAAAMDEMKLVDKMLVWKPYVFLYSFGLMRERSFSTDGNRWRKSRLPASGSTLARQHRRHRLIIIQSLFKHCILGNPSMISLEIDGACSFMIKDVVRERKDCVTRYVPKHIGRTCEKISKADKDG